MKTVNKSQAREIKIHRMHTFVIKQRLIGSGYLNISFNLMILYLIIKKNYNNY